ncbi:MAG: hypothetical protein ACRELA_02110 [Candidatus Rokuibacteriota bacterium]
MTDSEYERLRQHVENGSQETRRHFDVVAEGLRSDIRGVAEGVLTLDAKIERFREDVRAEFDEVKAMIKFSYTELDRRIRTLEDVVASLSRRVERLEGRPS